MSQKTFTKIHIPSELDLDILIQLIQTNGHMIFNFIAS